MNNRQTLGLAGKILAGGLALTGLARTTNANAIIRTVPEQATMVADGNTEYRVDVKGNTQEEVDKQFAAASWYLYLPDQVSFTRSSLPDPINNPSQNTEDFFYNWLMNTGFNRVDNTTESGGPAGWTQQLRDNVRLEQESWVGPANVNDKILGQYWFTVNPGTEGTQTRFLLAGEKFTDVSGCNYVYPGSLTRDRVYFNIVAPCWADKSGVNDKRDGSVNNYDVEKFRACASGSQVPYAAGCNWADTDLDNDVDQDDFGVFQRCLGTTNDECNSQ